MIDSYEAHGATYEVLMAEVMTALSKPKISLAFSDAAVKVILWFPAGWFELENRTPSSGAGLETIPPSNVTSYDAFDWPYSAMPVPRPGQMNTTHTNKSLP